MVWSFLPIKEFDRLAEQWDQLNQVSGNSPLVDSKFIAPLLDCFSTGREIIGCYHEAGIAKAMTIMERKSLFSWSTFQPNQAPLGFFIADPELDRCTLYNELIRALPGPAQIAGIMFQDVDHYSRIPNSETVSSHRVYYTPRIELNGNFEEFWSARSKSFRKQFNNRYNKLESAGIESRYRFLSSAEDLRDGVRVYGLIESSGWKGRSKTAVHPDNVQGQLYSDMLAGFSGAREARVYQYLYNDEVVASDLCLLRDKVLYILKTTYNEEYADTSPTQLMRREYIEDMFKNGEVKAIESFGRIKIWHQNVAQNARPIFVSNIYRYPLVKRLHSRRLGNKIRNINDRIFYNIECFPSFGDLPQKLKKALKQRSRNDFFHSLDWYELLEQQILEKGQELKVYVVSDGLSREPYMIYPITRVKRSRLLGSSAVLGNFSCLYDLNFSPVFLNDGYDLENMLSFFLNHVSKENDWDVLDLNLLLNPEDEKNAPKGDFFRALEKATSANFKSADIYHHSVNWTTDIPEGGYDAYIASRPSNLRNTLKRKLQKLSKSADYELVCYDNPDNIDKAISDYQTIYDVSWKEPENYPKFMPAFLRALSSAGTLRLFIMYIDGKPASFVAMIVMKGQAIIYKLAYDPEFKKYSPGSLILADAIRHVVENDGAKSIDFGMGDDNFKVNWMTERSFINGIIIHNLATPWGLFGALIQRLGKWNSRIQRKKES